MLLFLWTVSVGCVVGCNFRVGLGISLILYLHHRLYAVGMQHQWITMKIATLPSLRKTLKLPSRGSVNAWWSRRWMTMPVTSPTADCSTGWKDWYRISRHWFLLSMLTVLSPGHVVDFGKMLEFIIWLFMTASRFGLVQFIWIMHTCSIPTFYNWSLWYLKIYDSTLQDDSNGVPL